MKDIMETVAGFMAMSARTAPKARGNDYLETRIITGEEMQQLAEEMKRFGEEKGTSNIVRDGGNVASSEAVLLLSLESSQPLGVNCGACGYDSCEELEKDEGPDSFFKGPICTWRAIDLGIALGSAAKTASIHNADNRIMMTIGVVARKMGLIRGEIVVGIPISASGKSVYYDR